MRTGKVARIADRVRKELGELTPQERDLAVKALRDALYEGFALDAATSDPKQMEACVRCGSIRIIRKGRGRDGSQRWKCMNCNRTFGVRTNRVMGMSKLKAGVWMRFLECFVDCLSLRKCAQRCGVCLKTAFLMRQRVIECIRRYTPVLRSEAGSCVQLDETYFRESFKGNHTKSTVFVMPRKAHKRTKALRKRGLSKEQICDSPLSQVTSCTYSQPFASNSGCTVAQPASVFQNHSEVEGFARFDHWATWGAYQSTSPSALTVSPRNPRTP